MHALLNQPLGDGLERVEVVKEPQIALHGALGIGLRQADETHRAGRGRARGNGVHVGGGSPHVDQEELAGALEPGGALSRLVPWFEERPSQVGMLRAVCDAFNGDGILATTAQLAYPTRVHVDASGAIYIADTDNHRIRKVDAVTGLISTIAGTGTAGCNGDGILATAAQLYSPYGVFVDASGTVYISDSGNNRIRKVYAVTGMISTIAGTGVGGYTGDGILATNTQLYYPAGVFVDAAGAVYIADQNNNRIRKVDAVTALASSSSTIPAMRSFISRAALLVKVTAVICAAFIPSVRTR